MKGIDGVHDSAARAAKVVVDRYQLPDALVLYALKDAGVENAEWHMDAYRSGNLTPQMLGAILVAFDISEHDEAYNYGGNH